MSDGIKKYFENRMQPPDENGCIEWRTDRTLAKGGYPMFQMRASRLSYMLYKGYAPKDKIMLHSCDNPACVNPEHLRVGTYSENMYEMHSKKKKAHYLPKKYLKLNSVDISRINKQLTKGKSPEKIAKSFSVSVEIIEAIRDGKEWNNLE